MKPSSSNTRNCATGAGSPARPKQKPEPGLLRRLRQPVGQFGHVAAPTRLPRHLRELRRPRPARRPDRPCPACTAGRAGRRRPRPRSTRIEVDARCARGSSHGQRPCRTTSLAVGRRRRDAHARPRDRQRVPAGSTTSTGSPAVARSATAGQSVAALRARLKTAPAGASALTPVTRSRWAIGSAASAYTSWRRRRQARAAQLVVRSADPSATTPTSPGRPGRRGCRGGRGGAGTRAGCLRPPSARSASSTGKIDSDVQGHSERREAPEVCCRITRTERRPPRPGGEGAVDDASGAVARHGLLQVGSIAARKSSVLRKGWSLEISSARSLVI